MGKNKNNTIFYIVRTHRRGELMSNTKYAERVTPMGIPHTRLDDLPDLIDV